MTITLNKKHQKTSREKEIIINKISKFLQRNYPNILFGYVHGSFLSECPFADIDVGLKTRNEMECPAEYEIAMEIALEKIVPFPCDIRLMNQAPASFIQNVIRTGKLILDREPNIRADFESLKLREYYDFLPVRKQYLRESLAHASV